MLLLITTSAVVAPPVTNSDNVKDWLPIDRIRSPLLLIEAFVTSANPPLKLIASPVP